MQRQSLCRDGPLMPGIDFWRCLKAICSFFPTCLRIPQPRREGTVRKYICLAKVHVCGGVCERGRSTMYTMSTTLLLLSVPDFCTMAEPQMVYRVSWEDVCFRIFLGELRLLHRGCLYFWYLSCLGGSSNFPHHSISLDFTRFHSILLGPAAWPHAIACDWFHLIDIRWCHSISLNTILNTTPCRQLLMPQQEAGFLWDTMKGSRGINVGCPLSRSTTRWRVCFSEGKTLAGKNKVDVHGQEQKIWKTYHGCRLSFGRRIRWGHDICIPFVHWTPAEGETVETTVDLQQLVAVLAANRASA